MYAPGPAVAAASASEIASLSPAPPGSLPADPTRPAPGSPPGARGPPPCGWSPAPAQRPLLRRRPRARLPPQHGRKTRARLDASVVSGPPVVVRGTKPPPHAQGALKLGGRDGGGPAEICCVCHVSSTRGDSRIRDYLIISLRRAGQTVLLGATSSTSNISVASVRKCRSRGSLRKDAAMKSGGAGDAGIGSDTAHRVETRGSTRSASYSTGMCLMISNRDSANIVQSQHTHHRKR